MLCCAVVCVFLLLPFHIIPLYLRTAANENRTNFCHHHPIPRLVAETTAATTPNDTTRRRHGIIIDCSSSGNCFYVRETRTHMSHMCNSIHTFTMDTIVYNAGQSAALHSWPAVLEPGGARVRESSATPQHRMFVVDSLCAHLIHL